ncbi:MAG: hypothetical protein GXP31_07825 [Kiritimatiellaeota bacterium]|nr:hypothetical protein [Kiritimatiellota bacterium]
MQPIRTQLLFYRGIGWISRLIRWQTRSPVSHVALMRDGEARHVIEAWQNPLPRGLVHHNVGNDAPFRLHTPGTVVEVYSVPRLCAPGGEWIDGRVWKWAMQQAKAGVAYDFRMVLRFLPKLPETPGSRRKLFCSELAAMAFVIGCYPLLERIPPAYVSPGMLRASPLLNYEYSMRWDAEQRREQRWVDERLASEDRAQNAQAVVGYSIK